MKYVQGTGKGVKIAVVDSGVSPEHPYVSNVVGGVGIGFDAHGDVVYNEDDYLPETLWSHGQVCAGLISHLCIILPVAL